MQPSKLELFKSIAARRPRTVEISLKDACLFLLVGSCGFGILPSLARPPSHPPNSGSRPSAVSWRLCPTSAEISRLLITLARSPERSQLRCLRHETVNYELDRELEFLRKATCHSTNFGALPLPRLSYKRHSLELSSLRGDRICCRVHLHNHTSLGTTFLGTLSVVNLAYSLEHLSSRVRRTRTLFDPATLIRHHWSFGRCPIASLVIGYYSKQCGCFVHVAKSQRDLLAMTLPEPDHTTGSIRPLGDPSTHL